jgi:CheY-like chemotaxis protein
MSDSIEVELIKIIPSLLWFLFLLAVIVLFYRPIRDLVPNLSSFKAAGVELSFLKESIDAAIKLAEKSPQWKIEIPHRDKERALDRVKRHLKIFNGVQILWVDDHPENNLNERDMFCQLKAKIDSAVNTEEALNMLRNVKYDVVISDMAREGDLTAGLTLLDRLRKESQRPAVIFYVGVFNPEKGIPPLAFGITNRPDELLHLVLDVLERKRY